MPKICNTIRYCPLDRISYLYVSMILLRPFSCVRFLERSFALHISCFLFAGKKTFTSAKVNFENTTWEDDSQASWEGWGCYFSIIDMQYPVFMCNSTQCYDDCTITNLNWLKWSSKSFGAFFLLHQRLVKSNLFDTMKWIMAMAQWLTLLTCNHIQLNN